MTPNALRAAVDALTRDYGSQFSVVAMEDGLGGGAILVRDVSGSRFWIASDRAGCHVASDDSSIEALRRTTTEHRKEIRPNDRTH